MHSVLLTGIRMGPLMTLLRQHGFTPSPRNLGRLLFLFQNGLWSSILTWREKRINGEKIRSFPVPDDPLIIIGHWRTGSTYLQQLLALDEQLVTPRLFQTSFPDSFLVSEKFFRPVMGTLVTKRPMDNIKFGFDAPNEDEFALLKLTMDSPLLKVIFPERAGYFMNDLEDFIPKVEKIDLWMDQMKAFAAKVCGNSGRTLLLKNPAHSLRIPVLEEIFPKARYVHLHRHPYEVAASSLHLWKVMADGNQLKGKTFHPGLQEIAEGMAKFYRVILRDFELIPPERKYEICYEDLEKDPAQMIRSLYGTIGLEFPDGFESNLRAFPEKNRGFRKNRYIFDDGQRELVYRHMKEEFKRYSYRP